MSKSILAVDDSRTMREMVSQTLRGAGFTVVVAEDGNAAMRAIETSPTFDLVITDLNMPGMDGFELISNLRNKPNYKFSPIIMLTTESDTDKKERGKTVGATGWIVKPFNPEKLLQIVNKICP